MPQDSSVRQEKLSKEQIAGLIADRKRELDRSILAQKIEARKKQIDEELKGKIEPIPEEKSRSYKELGKEGLRQVGRTGRLFATGIAGLGDIPNIGAMGLHAAGLKETPEFYPSPARAVQSGIDTLTGGRLKPRNKTEEYVDTIGEGLAPIVLAPLTGGASLTSTAAKGLSKLAPVAPLKKIASAKFKPYELTAPKVGANIGASSSSKNYAENTEDAGPLGTLGMGILGSVAGGKVGRSGATLPHYVRGGHSQAYTDLKSLNVPMSVSDVSPNNLTNYVDLILGKDIGGSSVMKKHQVKRNKAFARNLGKTGVEPLENPHQIPREMAKEGARGYEDLVGKIFSELKEPIAAKEQAALQNYRPIDITDLRRELLDEQKGLKSKSSIKKHEKETPGYLRKEVEKYSNEHSKEPKAGLSSLEVENLKKQGYSQDIIDRIQKETSKKSNKYEIPYGEFEQLRNEALELKDKDLTRKNVKAYDVFRKRREEFMGEIGTPKEVEDYIKANKFYSKYKSRAESDKSVSHLVEEIKKAPDDAQAFNKLTSTNPRYATIVMNGLPKDKRRQLTEAVISDFGEDNGKFNIFRAHTKLSKLEKPVLEANLKGFSPGERNNFNKALEYIGKLKERNAELANTSNTAHTMHMLNQVGAVGSAGYSLLTGNITPVVTVATGYLLKQGTAKLWTNQTFVKQFDRLQTAKTHTQKVRALDHVLQNPVVRQVLEKDNKD